MTTQRISDTILERYLLRELPEDELTAIDRQAATDAILRARIDALTASNREILERYPAERMTAAIEARAARKRETPRSSGAVAARRGRSWLRLAALPGLAAAAVVLLVLAWPLATNRTLPGWGDGTRIKGAESPLMVYRQAAGGAEPLAARARVRERDLLQVGYFAAEEGYGMIISIDGAGTVTVHHPAGGADQRLTAKRRVLLDGAYELDNAPGFERFILVTAPAPIDQDRVLAQARRLARDPGRAREGALDLGAGYHQESLLLLKE